MMAWLIPYLREEPLALPTIILCVGFLAIWWFSRRPAKRSPKGKK